MKSYIKTWFILICCATLACEASQQEAAKSDTNQKAHTEKKEVKANECYNAISELEHRTEDSSPEAIIKSKEWCTIKQFLKQHKCVTELKYFKNPYSIKEINKALRSVKAYLVKIAKKIYLVPEPDPAKSRFMRYRPLITTSSPSGLLVDYDGKEYLVKRWIFEVHLPKYPLTTYTIDFPPGL